MNRWDELKLITIEDRLTPELRQRLETIKRKKEASKLRGVVKWFNPKKGWGFITSESGQDFFIHWRDIAGKGWKTLMDGEDVAFEVDEDARGRQRAVNVQVLHVATADPVDEEGQPKNNQEVSKRVFT